MAKTKQQIGRMARNKGKRFERQCHSIMWDISGWQWWKRTQRGDTQHNGDLIPCTEDGRPLLGEGIIGRYYVECRARATVGRSSIIKWIEEVRDKAGDPCMWVLLVKANNGPTLAICAWEQTLGEAWKARIY